MQTAPITFLFSDGVSHRFQAEPGQPLVQAAAAAGLNLLTDCANGQCGTCTAQLVSGAIDMGEYDDAVLPHEDRAGGSVLPCVCRISGACAIEFPYDSSEAGSVEPEPAVARVVSIDAVASETMRLEVTVDAPLFFEPGQYVRIRPQGADVWRSYSMANPPGSERLVFFVRLVPGGWFSEWLATAKAGDQVELSVPHGSFFLREEVRPRLFVAGGTGLAPFLSMLDSLASSSAPVPAPTTVLVGVRTREHLFAQKALDLLKERIPGLAVHVAVEAGPADACHSGYATDLIPTLGLDPATRVYLCGPPPMVEAGRRAAAAAGLARNDVLCERFA